MRKRRVPSSRGSLVRPAGGSTGAIARPMEPIATAEASGLVPLKSEEVSELDKKVAQFVDELAALDSNSPEFGKKVDALTAMGRKEIAEAAGASNRFLDRPVKAIDKDTGIGSDLTELRRTVEDLDPGRGALEADRGRRLRAHRLAAERAGDVTGEDLDAVPVQVDLAEHIIKRLCRRRRIERDAGLLAERLDRLHGAVDVRPAAAPALAGARERVLTLDDKNEDKNPKQRGGWDFWDE